MPPKYITRKELEKLRGMGDVTSYRPLPDESDIFEPVTYNEKNFNGSSFLPDDQDIAEQEAAQKASKQIMVDRETSSQPNQLVPSAGGLFQTLNKLRNPGEVKPSESNLLDLVRPASGKDVPSDDGLISDLPDDKDIEMAESRRVGSYRPSLMPEQSSSMALDGEIPSSSNPQSKEKELADKLQQFLALQKGYNTNASVDGLKAEQDKTNDIIFANQMGKIGERFGAAIARSKPAYQDVFDENIKMAGQGADQYADRIKMEKLDPKSNESANARAILAQIMPSLVNNPNFQNASAADLEKLFPVLQRFTKPAGSTKRQVVPMMDENGHVVQYLVDKETGQKTPLGAAGFAMGMGRDPYTGENILIPRNGAPPPGSGKYTGASTPTEKQLQDKQDPNKPNFTYTDLDAKQREEVLKIQKEFREQGKEIQDFEGTLNGIDRFVSANLDGTISSIKRQLARTVGTEKGVLTNQDVQQFGGTDRVMTSLAQYAHAKVHGGMTPEIQDNFRKIIEVAKQNIADKRSRMEEEFFAPLRGILPQANEPAIQEILKGRSIQSNATPQGADSEVDTSDGETESKIAKFMRQNPRIKVKAEARRILQERGYIN